MANVLARKLSNFTALSHDDHLLLDRVAAHPERIARQQDIVCEGETPEYVRLILSGFACRYKTLPDGKRQIVAYLVPGDFCDMHVFILRSMDHSIATLSECTVASIPREVVLELTRRPTIAQALWWSTLVDEATLREWLLNVGQRRAEVRIAHLLCELLLRLRTVGLAENSYALPITQLELADTVGLSAVHVNRSLQILRSQGLITFEKQMLIILDVDRLFAFSDFNPNYLHLAYRSGAGYAAA